MKLFQKFGTLVGSALSSMRHDMHHAKAMFQQVGDTATITQALAERGFDLSDAARVAFAGGYKIQRAVVIEMSTRHGNPLDRRVAIDSPLTGKNAEDILERTEAVLKSAGQTTQPTRLLAP